MAKKLPKTAIANALHGLSKKMANVSKNHVLTAKKNVMANVSIFAIKILKGIQILVIA
jgi:hypothetical protein